MRDALKRGTEKSIPGVMIEVEGRAAGATGRLREMEALTRRAASDAEQFGFKPLATFIRGASALSHAAVVASCTGTAYCVTDASDSPSSRRISEEALPSAVSTSSRFAAWTWSDASVSPLSHLSARSVITYSDPMGAIAPVSSAFTP